MGMIDDVGISKLAYRPLELIWVLDTSRSMCGERIIALNNAIRESIPDMNEALKENPSVNVNISSIVYNTGAVWTNKNVILNKFNWQDVTAKGKSELGAAIDLLIDKFSIGMPNRGLPPVIILISDGRPSDSYKEKLKKFISLPWGKRSVRIALAVASADKAILKRFTIGQADPINIDDCEQMMKCIKFVSTNAIKSVSQSGTYNINAEYLENSVNKHITLGRHTAKISYNEIF